MLSAAGAELRDLDYLTQAKTAEEDVEIINVTDNRGVLVLAGPRSRDVLAKVTEEKLDNAANASEEIQDSEEEAKHEAAKEITQPEKPEQQEELRAET